MWFDARILYDMLNHGASLNLHSSWCSVKNLLISLFDPSCNHLFFVVPTPYVLSIAPDRNQFFGPLEPLRYIYQSYPCVCSHLNCGDGVSCYGTSICHSISRLDHKYYQITRNPRGSFTFTGIAYYSDCIEFYNSSSNLHAIISSDASIKWSKPLLLSRNHIVKKVLLGKDGPLIYYGPEDLSRRFLLKWRIAVVTKKKQRCLSELLFSPYLPLWFKNNYHASIEHWNRIKI